MTKDIELFTQNSIKIMEGDRRIYIDPFQMRREPQNADFILITHDHYDHFSPKDIAKVASQSTILVVPETMAEKAKEVESLVAKICTVRPGEEYVFDGLRLETVAAYNIGKAFHPKESGWVGYIVIIAGQRIYIAGDTDINDDNINISCDIALVPVGGTYTMDARKAAELINKIRPQTAIPIHYGSIVGSRSDGEEFAKHVEAPVRVELKLQF